jgi:hypothetical protein
MTLASFNGPEFVACLVAWFALVGCVERRWFAPARQAEQGRRVYDWERE